MNAAKVLHEKNVDGDGNQQRQDERTQHGGIEQCDGARTQPGENEGGERSR